MITHRPDHLLIGAVLASLFSFSPAWAASPYARDSVPPPPAQQRFAEPKLLLDGSAAKPQLVATIDESGACVTDLTDVTDQKSLDEYNEYCGQLLIPISPALSVPGALFIGGAFGSKASKFVIAPAVGVNGGATFPLVRPALGYLKVGEKVTYRLPEVSKFFSNVVGSLNVGVAGLIFPGETEASGGTATDLAWSMGGYVGLEFGTVSFTAQGTQRLRVSGTLGLVVGYLGASKIVGDALLVGVQPGFAVSF